MLSHSATQRLTPPHPTILVSAHWQKLRYAISRWSIVSQATRTSSQILTKQLAAMSKVAGRFSAAAVVGDVNGSIKRVAFPDVYAQAPPRPKSSQSVSKSTAGKSDSAALQSRDSNPAMLEWQAIMNQINPKVHRFAPAERLSRQRRIAALLSFTGERGGSAVYAARQSGVVERWATNDAVESMSPGTLVAETRLQNFSAVTVSSGGSLVPGSTATTGSASAAKSQSVADTIVGVARGPLPGRILTCTEDGRLRISELPSQRNIETTLSVGQGVCCMRGCTQARHLVAVGGKELDIKIFDVAAGQQSFAAENVPDDWLDMRVPIWNRDLRFRDESNLITATGFGQVRVYDIRAGTRPQQDWRISEGSDRDGWNPLMRLALGKNQHSAFVGDTMGNVFNVDLRKGKRVHTYPGAAGSIRGLEVHPELPLLFSVSLDRKLRVHDIESRSLLQSVYLKQHPTSLAVISSNRVATHKSQDKSQPDELWDELERRERTGKRKRKRDLSQTRRKKR